MKNATIRNQQNARDSQQAARITASCVLVLFTLTTIFIPIIAMAQSVWSSQDVGAPPIAGYSELQDGGVVSVSGCGGTSGTNDAFQYCYQTLSGDGQIVGQLNSFQTLASSGKTGLMIRNSLNPKDVWAGVLVGSTNNAPSAWAAFNYRTILGTNEQGHDYLLTTFPTWFKLVRTGTAINAYTGATNALGVLTGWTNVQNVNLTNLTSDPIDIGIASTGYVGSGLSTGNFSNVTVTSYSPEGIIDFDNQAGNVVSIDQTVGQTTFNNCFQQLNKTGATWTNGYSGLNLNGRVQAVDTSSPQTGYAFYDTSVIPGTGGNSGIGGTEANQFQYGYYTATFSLKNYASSANQVGLYLWEDAGSVGTGNIGYVITVNPFQTNGNWYFQYSMNKTSGYAPGTLITNAISSTPIPLSNSASYSPFYTLGVTATGYEQLSAQIYDSKGLPLGSSVSLNNDNVEHLTTPGMMGFLVSATNAGTGANVYQISYNSSTAPTPQRVWYVNNTYTGGLGSPNGYYNTPFTTISSAETNAVNGDIVEVAASATTYSESVATGTHNTNITFRAASPWGAKVMAPTTNSNTFNFGDYVTVDGFDISTPSGSWQNGIFSKGSHVIVRNCYVHDCGGAGIGLDNSDYRIVYHNVVARNAYNNPSAASGISFWGFNQADSNSGYHSMVCNNICYANDNKFPTNQAQHIFTSDGEGIIIDDNRNTQSGHGLPQNINYLGAYTLIANNLIFNNGGRGIQVFLSNNIDIVNNTLFQDNTRGNEESATRGEIAINDAYRVTIANNIACSTNAPNPTYPLNETNTPYAISGETGTNNACNYITFLNNMAYDSSGNSNTPPVNTNYYNSPGATMPTYSTANGNINGSNPRFLNAIANAALQNTNIAATSDFQQYLGLTNASPAIDAATAGFLNWSGSIGFVPARDLKGNPRPSSYGYYDIGAYQYTTSP